MQGIASSAPGSSLSLGPYSSFDLTLLIAVDHIPFMQSLFSPSPLGILIRFWELFSKMEPVTYLIMNPLHHWQANCLPLSSIRMYEKESDH